MGIRIKVRQMNGFYTRIVQRIPRHVVLCGSRFGQSSLENCTFCYEKSSPPVYDLNVKVVLHEKQRCFRRSVKRETDNGRGLMKVRAGQNGRQ